MGSFLHIYILSLPEVFVGLSFIRSLAFAIPHLMRAVTQIIFYSNHYVIIPMQNVKFELMIH